MKYLRLFSVLFALSLRTGGLHCAKRCGPRTDKPVGLQPGHLPALSLTFDVGRRAGVEGSSEAPSGAESLGHRGEGSDLVQGPTLPVQRAWLFLYSAPHFPNPVPLPWVSVPGLSYQRATSQVDLTETCCHTVLEAGSLRPTVLQDHASSETLGGVSLWLLAGATCCPGCASPAAASRGLLSLHIGPGLEAAIMASLFLRFI